MENQIIALENIASQHRITDHLKKFHHVLGNALLLCIEEHLILTLSYFHFRLNLSVIVLWWRSYTTIAHKDNLPKLL